MNKKVSKTLAAVLSAAMAASAFAVSTGAAFAADNQISASVAPFTVGITNNADKSGSSYVDLGKLVDGKTGTITVNGVTSDATIKLTGTDGWQVDTNDTSIVTVNANGRLTPWDQATNLTSPRTVVVTHQAELTAKTIATTGTGSTAVTADHVTVAVEVTVYPEGKYIILPQTNYAVGATPASEETISMNQKLDLAAYLIEDDKSGQVKFDKKWGEGSSTDGALVGGWTATSNWQSDNDAIDVNIGTGLVEAQDAENPQVGSAEITATIYKNNNSKDWGRLNTSALTPVAEDLIPFTVNVDDTYKVMGNANDEFIANGSVTESEDKKPYHVEGKDIIVDLAANGNKDDNKTSVNIGADAVVGTITNNNDAGVPITVTGTTEDITSAGTVNVQDNLKDYPKAGSTITTGNISAPTINVTGTNVVSNVTGNYEGIETGDLEGSNINITAYDNQDEEQPQGRGTVKVGNITILRDAQDPSNTGLTLTAGQYVNTMTLGTISGEAGPYEDSPYGAQVSVNQGTFSLGDLDKVGKVTIGTKNTTADVTVGTIDTGSVTSTGLDKTVNAGTLQINAKSALTADSVTVDHILDRVGSGAGSLTMTDTDSLFIMNDSRAQSGAINAYLYVPNAQPGDTLYTKYNDQGSNYIFIPGANKVLGVKNSDKSYSFQLQEVGFEGIRMVNKAVSVGETPVTLSLAAMPDSAELPDGVTVSWTATKNAAGEQTVSLTPSADGMSCVVAATGYTEDNINGGNNVVVTATLMKDGKVYGDVAANSVNATVTLTNETADIPLTGIALSETSMTMQPEETQQLTVTYTPADTNSDKTVTWSTSDEAVATVDAEGNVTAVADGTATITATCGEFTATCEVTVSENPFTVVVTNAEGEKTTCAADGSTVIEVPQSMAFNFDISSEEEIADFDYTVGNCKVGGTNTNTVWNGTSGSYQIYAAGAVGSETGAYINGIKIFTLRVTDRPFTSDTTLNMNISRGQTYQFAITPDDPNASFTFLTANGEALSTSYNKAVYPDATGTYYCKVTANAVNQDVGVYCVIDGKTYKVFTAHLVG